MRKKHRQSIPKGIAAGSISGLAASWVMNQFQAGLSKLQSQSQSENEEPATVKAAVAISRKVLRHELSPEEKPRAGEVVHYVYGTVIGGLYGAAAEISPLPRAAAGVLFGSLLWLLSDEIAVPAAGLASPPSEHPISVHVSALGAHIVYGVSTELIRRGLRAAY